MPGGNGTGPMGMGPMTGRAAGLCAGYGVPGYANGVPGRGFGRGFGMGRGFGRGMGRGGFGFRNQFQATGLTGWQRAAGAVPQSDVEALKNQAKFLADTLADVQKQIGELEAAETMQGGKR